MEEKKLDQIEQSNETANENNNTEKDLWEVLQRTSLEQSQSYFNSVEQKTGIPCTIVERWSADGEVVDIPFWLPSKWIRTSMNYHNIPKEVADIIVNGYKNIYLGSRCSPQYDLKIEFWWKIYVISPVDFVNLEEVVSEEEKYEWIEYLKNRGKPLVFFEDYNWQLSDIHDWDWPYWWGKIIYIDPSYESFETFEFNHNDWGGNHNFPKTIDKEQYEKGILLIVPYWTYEWNHNSRYSFIVPIDDDLSKNILFED